MIAIGGALVTVGGYLAKDGWDEMKKQPTESAKLPASQDNSLDKVYLLLKKNLERRSQDASSEAVLSYVREVAKDSTSLAGVWSEILEDLKKGVAFKENNYLHEIENKYGYRNEPNAPYFYRLKSFYRLLEKIPNNSLDSSWIPRLSESLNKMMYTRPEMLETMRMISSGNEKEKMGKELTHLNDSVILLHKEAAKINALLHELQLYTASNSPTKQ